MPNLIASQKRRTPDETSSGHHRSIPSATVTTVRSVDPSRTGMGCSNAIWTREKNRTGLRWYWSTVKTDRVERAHMTYTLRCDKCEIDQTFTEWADANWAASNHEADNPTHWVTILDTQPA